MTESNDPRARAEARTDLALQDSPYEDPRPLLRTRMRFLRDELPSAYNAARLYYEETLVPALAEGAEEPLTAWIEYGRRIGELAGPGKTVAIDETGRARPHRGSISGELVLHLPNDTAVEALPLAVPRTLSNAQRASYELLINCARAL